MIYNKNTYLISKLSLKLSVFTMLIAFVCKAQQMPHYGQYYNNMEVLNPAFVGYKSDLNATLLHRQQWVGVEGAPQTTTFTASGRINAGFGFGVTAINDNIGLLKNNVLNTDISYTLALSEFGRLTFGFKAGVAIFTNDLASGITPDNEVYASISGNYGNFGFGALYRTKNFFVGLGVPNVLKSPVFRLDPQITNTKHLYNDNYFFSTGAVFYPFKFNEGIAFKPSTIIKYTPSLPLSIDVNANVIFNNKFETGISYRYQNSINAMVAFNITESLKIGYTYENQLNSIGNNFNTHEILLRLDLKLIRNTRWLYEDCCYF